MDSIYEEDELSACPPVTYVASNECTTLNIDDDAREVKKQTTDLKLISKETYNETMRPQFEWKDSRRYLLDKWLEKMGQKLLVDPDNNKELEMSVLEFVRSLSDHMCDQEYSPASTEVNFDVEVLGIGSYYSRTKKHPADEFDFLFESKLRTDQLRFIHQPLPNTETTNFSRPDFFRIYDTNNHELKAEDWRKTFQRGLTNTLKSRFPDCAVEYNGPALSFIVESIAFNKDLKSPVKVDMTFGIRLDTHEPDHIWPLQSTHVELATNTNRSNTRPTTRTGKNTTMSFCAFR